MERLETEGLEMERLETEGMEMEILETERLELVPLRAELLRMWTEDIPGLEKRLGCIYKAEPMEGMFLQIVGEQLKITECNPSDYCWHSFWLLIHKSDRVVVGAADFKGRPDENGEVEIGYGLGNEFEHKGYMTEAVKAMCGWAFSQEGVRQVTAETDKQGTASQRVLKRCGFVVYRQEETLWWKCMPGVHGME